MSTQKSTREPRLLLGEDDEAFRELLAQSLRRDGWSVEECATGVDLAGELLDVFSERGTPFDLMISDVRMPGMTGLSVLEGLSQHGCTPPAILITAFGDAETHARARDHGAVAVLDKPFDVAHLVRLARTFKSPRSGRTSPGTPRRGLDAVDVDTKNERRDET